MRNRQLSGYQKKSNRNFISLAGKLFKLREERVENTKQIYLEKINKLLLKIKETHPISNKNWIVKQGEALKTKW